MCSAAYVRVIKLSSNAEKIQEKISQLIQIELETLIELFEIFSPFHSFQTCARFKRVNVRNILETNPRTNLVTIFYAGNRCRSVYQMITYQVFCNAYLNLITLILSFGRLKIIFAKVFFHVLPYTSIKKFDKSLWWIFQNLKKIMKNIDYHI